VGRLAGAGVQRRVPAGRTRTGRQVSDSLPELAGLVEALRGYQVILGRP
jgi:hypothetical protein